MTPPPVWIKSRLARRSPLKTTPSTPPKPRASSHQARSQAASPRTLVSGPPTLLMNNTPFSLEAKRSRHSPILWSQNRRRPTKTQGKTALSLQHLSQNPPNFRDRLDLTADLSLLAILHGSSLRGDVDELRVRLYARFKPAESRIRRSW